MREVMLGQVPLDRLAGLLSSERVERLEAGVSRAREVFDGRTLWNVNATATGGGVAEMLQALLAYTKGAGIQTRWLVLDGDPGFFTITKRLHNMLHGTAGDHGVLGGAEQEHYRDVLATNADSLRELVAPGDVVLLHDPQTAGLAEALRAGGAQVVWRCHVGADRSNELTENGWGFLEPHLQAAQAFVFSRRQYAPGWLPPERVYVIPPSLDPFSAKNAEMSPADADAALREAGLVDTAPDHGSLGFVRRDGSPGVVRPHTGLVLDGAPLPREARIMLQVSRWDRLKDMTGVLRAFAEHVHDLPKDLHLLLAGPDVSGVSDDPEGAEVLQECMGLWEELPDPVRRRTHLATLPMDDTDENAHLVNALQRRAAVVVQKSLVEGFGLTVTEPMWKSRPVVASRVGGIQDQVVHGQSGLLLDDPEDLAGFAGLVEQVLADEQLALALGAGARARVQDRFLGDRHLVQYADLFEQLD